MIPLPPAFAQRMQAELGADADAYFASLEMPYVRGLRINPLKAPDAPIKTLIQGLTKPIPWANDAYELEINSPAGSHPLHACGAYYLQEPSAMLPASLLKAQPGEIVLDLCAAPGGKSTQLAAQMRGQGTLVCNEIVRSRAAVLSGNLERMGVCNALVVSQNPETLAHRWPGLFNAILVDAPCSGEGMFRRHPEARLEWDAQSPQHCAIRQRLILDSAASMLKPDGRLCYSTCTFSREENEDVIHAFLTTHPEFEPLSFSVPLANGKALSSQGGCVRLYPHTVGGEGHFAALLQKNGTHENEASPVTLQAAQQLFEKPSAKDIALYQAFADDVSLNNSPKANALLGNLLISAPELPPLQGLKVYRAGLALGRVKGKVFLPDHALALAAPPLPMRSLALNDAQTAQYLRGEVLTTSDMERGFCTVTTGGLPLGFVKHSDGQLKNHYPKGLRKR